MPKRILRSEAGSVSKIRNTLTSPKPQALGIKNARTYAPKARGLGAIKGALTKPRA